MGISDFRLLTDSELASVYERIKHEQQSLIELNLELNNRDSDEAFDLQLEVVQTLRKLRASPTTPVRNSGSSTGPVRNWISAFLLARHLDGPTGNPIYRYRMTDTEYQTANDLLRQLAKAGRLSDPDNIAARLFVVFCAEWFRREAVSMFKKWDELAPDVFPSVPYSSKQKLTEIGLRYWKRELLTMGGDREFLLTLALEGGLPTNVVADGGRGWLNDYLRTVMRHGLVHSAREALHGFAHDMSFQLRPSYRHDHFVELCAELVERLLHWRQKAEREKPKNLETINFLDYQYPEWRDDLPIYVPAGQNGVAQRLLNGLLNEKVTGQAGYGVDAARFLIFRDGEWRAALQIRANGEIPSTKLQITATNGRYRAVPSGLLGDHVPSEFAMFEPPSEDQNTWRIRQLAKLDKLIVDFPFTSAVTTILTSGGSITPFTWPGGEAVRSEVLVFKAEDLQTEEGPPLLRLVRKGSTSLPIQPLYVLVPADWIVSSVSADPNIESYLVSGLNRRLFKIEETAFFTAPDEIGGASYRVEPGSNDRDIALQIDAKPAVSFESSVQEELFEAPISFNISENERRRNPLPNELFWRRAGSKWQPVTGNLNVLGSIEVSWREPKTNIQLEKLSIGIVPPNARIRVRMSNTSLGTILLERLPGWSIDISHKLCRTTKTAEDFFEVHFDGRPNYSVECRLIPPIGNSLELKLSLAGSDALIVLSDGSIVRPGQTIDLSSLRGALAVSSRKTQLTIARKGERANKLLVQCHGELPLATLRAAIEEVFAVAGSLDALVEMEFLGDTRPSVKLGRYKIERLASSADSQVSIELQGQNMKLVGRMLSRPVTEHLLEKATTEEAWQIPEQCSGPCIVYLRDGPDVISRPLLIYGPGNASIDTNNALQRAALDVDHASRKIAIKSVLETLCAPDADYSNITSIVELVLSLNGLSATAFDALMELPRYPSALVRILLHASEDAARQSVWNLQNELPFLWLALPSSAWKTALHAEWQSMESGLSQIDSSLRTKLILEHIRGLTEKLARLEPALEVIFAELNLPSRDSIEKFSLKSYAQAYARSSHSRDTEDSSNNNSRTTDFSDQLFSNGLTLPQEISDFDFRELTGLCVPAYLAASACERFKLKGDIAIFVRRILRENPEFISGAFPHLYAFYGAR